MCVAYVMTRHMPTTMYGNLCLTLFVCLYHNECKLPLSNTCIHGECDVFSRSHVKGRLEELMFVKL